MDRETALQNYREAVSRKIAAFRSHMGDSVLEHAEDWEAVVEKAMKLLGEQMEKQGKEYVCFLYFSLLKSDTINRNYRVQLHGLDMSWYMDKEPVEVYVDVKELLTPLDELWNELVCANQGYGVSVNEYDIQNLLFDELTIMDNMICQVLRYRLRDWEKKGIFEPVTRSPYWVLRWGEYRDQTEILVQTDRVEKEFGTQNIMALVVPKGDTASEKAVLKELSGLDEVDYAMGLSNVEAKPGYFLTDKLTPRQFSEMMGLSYEEACILYAAYTADQEDNYGPIVGGIDSYTVSAMDMILFIYQEKEKGYVTLDDEDEREINDAYTQITDAQTQMLGPNYTRMVMNLNLPEEGTDTFAFLKTVHSIVEKYYDADDVYLVGNSTSDYDQSVSFARDNVMISVLSVVFVVLVLVFTFMSVGLPILLILVIQGSIWINFTFPTVLHTNIFFMSYLIVTSIQMGANIDYAIVISTWYSDLKTRMSPREALIKALDLSFPTVLTSGSILSAAGFLIGQITTEPSIVGIGQCLSRGTLISMFLVMFVLPQILVLGDRIVEKTSFQVKLPATPIASQRFSGTTFVNGRVRGRISGFVDAEIHGVVKGDISAIMSSGSYDLPEGSGQPPEAGPSPEDTPNTPPADSVTGKEGDAQ